MSPDTFDLPAFFDAEFAEHGEITKRTRDALGASFRDLVQVCKRSLGNRPT